MATTPAPTTQVQKPNALQIADPSGTVYNFPIGSKVPSGWITKGQVFVQGGVSSAPSLATLYGPQDHPVVVAVGSKNASELLTQGYSLNKGAYKDPVKVAADAKTASAKQNTPLAPVSFKDDGSPYYLVRFKEPNGDFTDPTPGDDNNDSGRVWILDPTKGVYRPITGPSSLRSLAANHGVDQLVINDVPSSYISDPNQEIFNGQFLPISYAYTDSSQLNSYPEKYLVAPDKNTETPVDNAKGTVYGKAKMDDKSEATVANNFLSFLNTAATPKAQGGMGLLSKATVDKYVNNPNSPFLVEAFRAVAYGGYSMTDIYNELHAKEAADAGDATMSGYVGFSRSMDKNTWSQTAQANQMAKLTPQAPSELLFQGADVQASALLNYNSSYFSGITPKLDLNNPDDLAKIQAVEASFYDVANQLASADTEEEYGTALSNWQRYRDYIKDNLGIQLSSDARTAWNQLQQLSSQESTAGLGQSGIAQEASDRYLADRRRADQQNRDQSQIQQDDKQYNFVKQSGSTKDVQDLVLKWDEEDAAKGVAKDQYRSVIYGLKPSAESAQYFTLANFKTLYPTMTDDQLRGALDAYVDPNGNYRSSLYHTQLTNANIKNVVPDPITQPKQSYQVQVAQAQEEKVANAATAANQQGQQGAMNRMTDGSTPDSSAPSDNAQAPAAVTPAKSNQPVTMYKGGNSVLVSPDSVEYFKGQGYTESQGTAAQTTTPAQTAPVQTPAATAATGNPYDIVTVYDTSGNQQKIYRTDSTYWKGQGYSETAPTPKISTPSSLATSTGSTSGTLSNPLIKPIPTTGSSEKTPIPTTGSDSKTLVSSSSLSPTQTPAASQPSSTLINTQGQSVKSSSLPSSGWTLDETGHLKKL